MSSSTERLVQLINEQNPTLPAFTTESLNFSNPVEHIVEVNGCVVSDTKCTITANQNTPWEGSVDVTYRRVPLSEIGECVPVLSEVPFDIDTIVFILNTTRNTFLVDSDLEPINIPEMNVGDIETVVLTASSDSFGWVGCVSVSLLFGLPSNVSALHKLMNVTLPCNSYLTN
jgi:hypothetical protein